MNERAMQTPSDPRPAEKRRDEIRALTGLRFVAAFYVFVFHIHIRWPLLPGQFFGNVLNQGAIGMSLFFILSGFILTYTYADRAAPLKIFLLNRFARIYPIYALTAIATLPWFGVVAKNDSFGATLYAVFKGCMLIVSNILVVQAWIPSFFRYWNDGGSWSISVEFFCYLSFPLMLPLLLRRSVRQLYAVMVAAWVLSFLPGLCTKIFGWDSPGFIYSMPIFRLPEFTFGMCVCLLIRHGMVYRGGVWPQLFASLLLLVYLGLVGGALPLYVGHNWLVVPVIGFLIFSLAAERGILAAVLGSAPGVWLGRISYCFYSFQSLLLLPLIAHHDRLVQHVPILGHHRLFGLIVLLALTALSAAGYHLVEEPARRAIKRRTARREPASLAASDTVDRPVGRLLDEPVG